MKMNLTELTAIIEAIIFAAGEPVEGEALAEIAQVDLDTLNIAIERLKENIEEKNSGIILTEVGGAYQLATRPDLFDYVVKLVEPKRQTSLSNAALETLSIVAYNQPVTRSSIEFIRGVNSDGALNRLIERGMVEECGKLDTPGKPLLYKTTNEFLKCFGLKSIDELPDINNIPLQLTFYDM